MGEKVELKLEERTVLGKKVKALRQDGYVPAVVYGQGFATRSVMGPKVALTKAFWQSGKHHPVALQLGGTKQIAMIKSADFDPVKRELRHLAFHIIQQNEKVETEVPVVIEGAGETAAEKAGLVVLTTIDAIKIQALPGDLPDNLVLPSEKLTQVGDHLTVADISKPQGVTILDEPEQVIATVYEPSALAAANEKAAGDAEPGDEENVDAEQGENTPQDTQAEEDQPGGKKQFEPKGE